MWGLLSPFLLKIFLILKLVKFCQIISPESESEPSPGMSIFRDFAILFLIFDPLNSPLAEYKPSKVHRNFLESFL